ncbi:DUF2161 domain-containing phosphodiesterase [Paenibacillus tundrae]|uniref:Restriction endonuclease type IV Mrr domain-containing protein n=1 Tax=Paenibacillus tundrae TaxID=528187 RepID=A0ABT9WC47_9BACL|nr:DUF2161 family putative PD-(D/E)XK-type phosphodiesterase [Paenibacillus tundrae]MDQ0170833.1 hypothetical protein [Paenibacillus tundrae]
MAIQYETELYLPIKAFFEKRGYTVRAEVKHCDLVGIRANEDVPLIVEMKKSFNLSLLLQGMQRLKLSPNVYLAVERNRSKRGAVNQRWSELTSVCNKLGLGLIAVTFFKTKSPLVDVLCEPIILNHVLPSSSRKGGVRRQRLLREFDERTGDYNTGGSTRQPLMTAYREKALRVATALRNEGEASPAIIAKQTGVGSTASILQKNYYGWFERVSRGKYMLTVKGIEALTAHALMLDQQDLLELRMNELEWNNDSENSFSNEGEQELEHIAEDMLSYVVQKND